MGYPTIRSTGTGTGLEQRRDEGLQRLRRVLRQARIDQVPVVDDAGRAVGLLDVQDLLAARVL